MERLLLAPQSLLCCRCLGRLQSQSVLAVTGMGTATRQTRSFQQGMFSYSHLQKSSRFRCLPASRSSFRAFSSSTECPQVLSEWKSSFQQSGLLVRNSNIRLMSSKTQNSSPPSQKIPFWQRLLFVSGIGGVLYYIFKDAIHEKEIEGEQTRYQELGKAQLGGDWTLTDHHGKQRSSTEFHGQWVLLYFGFTHCPDICPEELEKLALVVKNFEDDPSMPDIQPLFVTLDPERDSPSVIKEYCAEYSPRLLGFTGSEDEIRAVCKKFRVYFGKGERDENNDYIVDHTIIIYLINPLGQFVNYFGRNLTAENVSKSVRQHIERYIELEQKGKLEEGRKS